jgi:DNA-binding transcriptional regulator GbsR (MarR family)
MINEIGETAGEIWAVLVEENKAMTVSQLRKKTKLPEDLLCMGTGWLAREDKLQFSGTSEAMEVSLKYL